MWNAIVWAFNLVFHAVPYSSSSASLQDHSRTVSVLPCHTDALDVLHGTLIPLLLRIRKEHSLSNEFEGRRALDYTDGCYGSPSSRSINHRGWQIRQDVQVDNFSIITSSNSADQAATETGTTVSLTQSESSSLATESASATESPSPASASSSSQEVTVTVSSSNDASATEQTVTPLASTSNVPESTRSATSSKTDATSLSLSSTTIATSTIAPSITSLPMSSSVQQLSLIAVSVSPLPPETTHPSSILTSRPSITTTYVSETVKQETTQEPTTSMSLDSSWSTISSLPPKTILNASSSSRGSTSSSKIVSSMKDSIIVTSSAQSISSTPTLTAFSSISTETIPSSSTLQPASPQPSSSGISSTSYTSLPSGDASASVSYSVLPVISTWMWNSSSATVVPVIIITTTVASHRASSSSTSVETGMLRPGAPSAMGFANNRGAIIGVSLSAAAALIALVFLIFFTCKRYKSRRSHDRSADAILTLAREVSWRRPLDDDDESINDRYGKSGSTSPPQAGTSQGHSIEGAIDGYGNTSVGDHISNGRGSSEDATAAIVRPANPTFGGQPYMLGFGQSLSGATTPPEVIAPPPAGCLPFSNIAESTPAWRTVDPFDQGLATVSIHQYASRSAASLTLGGASSSNEHGALSPYLGEGDWQANNFPSKKRKTLSGPRAMPTPMPKGRRHSSTPPTVFLGTRESMLDYEGQPPAPEPQSDRMSVKSFISRLRSGRRMSTQSVGTIRGGNVGGVLTQRKGSIESVMTAHGSLPTITANVYSPSLLNPPIPLPPRPLLSFPRGITANSYNPQASAGYQAAISNLDYNEMGHSIVLWPPATLPSAPSPAPTDNSSMIEGLLHPRLGMCLDHSQQASTTSFRDHEDYTRPINGLVNNHHRSTTTFEIQDTTGSEDGGTGQPTR